MGSNMRSVPDPLVYNFVCSVQYSTHGDPIKKAVAYEVLM